MGQENIKALLQCEKLALQIISDARKERDELKKKARADAFDIIDELRKGKEKELDELKKENAEKLIKIEEQSKAENKELMEQLEKVNYEKLVDTIVDMIYNVAE